jgi:hypothetical protein
MPKETVASISNHQRIFLRYLLLVLIDLTVLGFFAEYWSLVYIESFSIIFLAAVILQILLKITIVIEHKLASFFKDKPGITPKIFRFFTSWAVLFISKFIILYILNVLLGDKFVFSGPVHGVVAFIVVVFSIIIVEQLVIRINNRLK